MAIRDAAYNPIAIDTTAQVLGYTEPLAPEETLTLRIYNFLLYGIRREDEKATFFLKRFLQGPQELWTQFQQKIFDTKHLWDITKVDDEYLKYLKVIVGWTKDLDYITDDLDNITLRRLISASIALWRKRGPEGALVNILTLITGGARLKIWNWFDFRWVLNETELGVEHQGRDPWIIDLPNTGNDQEYYTNLRIVDDGDLNRNLVKNITKLMRACGERIVISYLNFLESFLDDGDDSQWNTYTSSNPTVLNGTAIWGDDTITEKSIINGSTNTIWNNYIATFRLKGESPNSNDEYGAIFYWSDDDNYYFVALDSYNKKVRLKKYTSGIESLISESDYPLYDDVYYSIRIHVSPENTTNRIKIYVDANEVINNTDSDHANGSIGIYHDINSVLELDETEMYQLPLETDLVDINT